MTNDTQRIEHLARRRAKAKLGWYTHAAVYAVVNLGLIALSVANGQRWAIFPLLGWGVGLAFHGAAVWLLQPGGNVLEHLVERERAKLVNENSGAADRNGQRADKW